MHMFASRNAAEMEEERPIGLVTGAGSGIGRASALAFARACGTVVVVDVDEEAAEETVSLIAALDCRCTAVCVRCDVSKEADVESMAMQVRQR